MNVEPLDNPVWQALISRHRHLAVRSGTAARYPADVAPFVAVESAQGAADEDLRQLVEAGESVYLVGVAPALTSGWEILKQTTIAQMICRQRQPSRPGPQYRELSAADRDDMLALTSLVFPGYFRARTNEMGRYLGIHSGDTLAAMAGERMCLEQYIEISAVCTHPDFTSRGFAARLIIELCHDIFARHLTPILHVNWENERARALYAKLGFVDRAAVGLWWIKRIRS